MNLQTIGPFFVTWLCTPTGIQRDIHWVISGFDGQYARMDKWGDIAKWVKVSEATHWYNLEEAKNCAHRISTRMSYITECDCGIKVQEIHKLSGKFEMRDVAINLNEEQP